MNTKRGSNQKKNGSKKEQGRPKARPSMWSAQKYKTYYDNACARYKKWHARPWWFEEANPVDRFTGWVMAFTGILVFVGFLQLNSLEKTEETSRAIQRAFVTSYKMAIDKVGGNNDVAYWKVSPVIENPGASQTIGMFYYLGLFETNPLPSNIINTLDPDKYDVEFTHLPIAAELGPKATFAPATLVVTAGQARAMREGTISSYVLGEAIFDDIFRIPHRVIFCYLLLGGTGRSGNIGMYGTHVVTPLQNDELSFRFCNRNNCSDKECGKIRRDREKGKSPEIVARKK